MSKCGKIREAWASGDRMGALGLQPGFLTDPRILRFSSAVWMHTTIQTSIANLDAIRTS